jgi:hypothetical protein
MGTKITIPEISLNIKDLSSLKLPIQGFEIFTAVVIKNINF